MSYFSLKTESFIVFNYNSSISHPKEDVTFYVALGNQASAKIYWGTDLVFETEPYQCYDKYYNLAVDRCCEQVKTFMVHDVDVSGLVAYYMRIEYKHKESIPCLRVMRESESMAFYDISNDSYSMTELKSSPFFIRPLINMDIKAIQNSTLEIIKFIDSNTE